MIRSLMIGDCDHYLSPYIFGVAQAMARLGHWHSQVSIRQPVDVIHRQAASWTEKIQSAQDRMSKLRRTVQAGDSGVEAEEA